MISAAWRTRLWSPWCCSGRVCVFVCVTCFFFYLMARARAREVARTVVAPPSSVVKCSFGSLWCCSCRVCVGGVVLSRCVCVCVCARVACFSFT